MRKPVRVLITGDARKEFEALREAVQEELREGIAQSDHQILLRAINHKVELLKQDPQYGIHIPKDRIPKVYKTFYDVNNLWKINLSGAWRMIYTIRGSQVEIIALILDILNHKTYDKKFGYR